MLEGNNTVWRLFSSDAAGSEKYHVWELVRRDLDLVQGSASKTSAARPSSDTAALKAQHEPHVAATTTSASELALRARGKVGRCPFMPRKLAAASELQIVWAESSNEPVYSRVQRVRSSFDAVARRSCGPTTRYSLDFIRIYGVIFVSNLIKQ